MVPAPAIHCTRVSHAHIRSASTIRDELGLAMTKQGYVPALSIRTAKGHNVLCLVFFAPEIGAVIACGPMALFCSGDLNASLRPNPFFSNRRSWNLEPVELLQFGLIVQARVCPLVRWSPGPLVLWSAGPLVRWSPAVRWSTGPLVPWSSGPSWIRYMLCKANKEANQQARKQASKQASKHELLTFGSGVLLGGGAAAPPNPPAPRNLHFIPGIRTCHEINILSKNV